MASGILVLCEIQDGKIKKTSFELLSKAKALAANLGGKVSAALLGQNVANLAGECAKYGADAIVVVDHEKLSTYSSSAYARGLVEAIKKKDPAVVLASGTP